MTVGVRHVYGDLALRGLHDARGDVDGRDGAWLVTDGAVGVGAVDAVAHVADPVAAAQLAGAAAALRLAVEKRLLLGVVATTLRGIRERYGVKKTSNSSGRLKRRINAKMPEPMNSKTTSRRIMLHT